MTEPATPVAPSRVRMPSDRGLAIILAIAAATFVWVAWGGLDQPGLYHDEKSYVLQSRIFADFHIAEPSPPVPELWEQVHVFTTPHYASRYPPGFPLALSLGTAVGLPGLIPVLCTAATAALLFLFGLQFVGRWTAFVATALWLSAPINIEWRASYFSESLTGLLWISWLYFAWKYRVSGERRHLVFTSLLMAFAALTRPMTAAVLALPTLFVLWPRIRTLTGIRQAAFAAAVGAALFIIVPLQNKATLDSWTKFPYTEYSTRTYPFDMPTWKTDWSPAPRELPPDLELLGEEQRKAYQARSSDSTVSTFIKRLNRASSDAVPFKYRWLRWLAPIGLIAMGGLGWIALASGVLLVAAHVVMPHALHWTIYYLDVFPAIAFGAVFALRRGLELIALGSPIITRAATHAPAGALTLGLALLVAGGTSWRPSPVGESAWMKREVYFRAGVCALPPGEKIVFVNPRPGQPHHILVDNDPDWQHSENWIVRLWTPERNAALMAAAPDRAAYVYQEKAGWMVRMNPDGTPGREGVLGVLDVDLDPGRRLTCK